MKLVSLVLAGTLVVVASAALAEDYIAFQSPTGNIHCNLYQWDGTTTARCDLREFTPSYTHAPEEGCDYDWGMAFAVNTNGKGYLACVSDTTVDRGNPVLNYGEAVSLGGISCVSAKTGITCTNAAGNGFKVAKAKQKLF